MNYTEATKFFAPAAPDNGYLSGPISLLHNTHEATRSNTGNRRPAQTRAAHFFI